MCDYGYLSEIPKEEGKLLNDVKSQNYIGHYSFFGHTTIIRMTLEQKRNSRLWFWLVITLLLAVLPWFFV